MTAKGVLGRALGAAASTSEIYTGWVGASCEFTHPQMRLPLLDMRRWHESPAAFAEELRIACHRFGFFQLRHRIPDHVAERAMNEARLFFARPVDEKQRIGYTAAVRQ